MGNNDTFDNRNLEVAPCVQEEAPEPEEGKNPWPYAVWLFFGIMIGWGATYLALEVPHGQVEFGDVRDQLKSQMIRNSVEVTDSSETLNKSKVDGGQIYASVCASCHQASGQGLPGAFPPLDGSPWVIQNKFIPAKIILKGLTGPIEVKGVTFNGVMPGFENQLSSEEIAAVVNFIRSQWSNRESDVLTGEEVQTLQKQLSGKKTPWTADELKSP
ncbi:MAG: cytochrome c [Bdellovibrionaceae bacterium]|nr:cytochrome c [Pseudobdellovibrionaceae bacterium]